MISFVYEWNVRHYGVCLAVITCTVCENPEYESIGKRMHKMICRKIQFTGFYWTKRLWMNHKSVLLSLSLPTIQQTISSPWDIWIRSRIIPFICNWVNLILRLYGVSLYDFSWRFRLAKHISIYDIQGVGGGKNLFFKRRTKSRFSDEISIHQGHMGVISFISLSKASQLHHGIRIGLKYTPYFSKCRWLSW